MIHWSDSFTSLVRFWQPQFDGLTRLTLTPLDFTTDLRHCRSVTASHPASHVAVAITLNAKVSSLKTLQTASKSAYKRQRNACSNYAPLERTALRTLSVTNKKTNTTFSHLQPARVVRSSPNFAW